MPDKGKITISRLCLHTMTTKPWDLSQAIEAYQKRGLHGMSIWRQAIAGQNLQQVEQKLKAAAIHPVSLVRGGFFTGSGKSSREEARRENRLALEECAALRIPFLVLVCGATPGLSIKENIRQIYQGIEELLPSAESAEVGLAVEPLHPMYADTRSAIATLKEANNLCSFFSSPQLGVAVDLFHTWWDPDLRGEILRCGKMDKLWACHISDWKTEMSDMLNDRGLMGEGIIPFWEILSWFDEAGFGGFHEVEIFSNYWWSQNQDTFLDKIIHQYKECC